MPACKGNFGAKKAAKFLAAARARPSAINIFVKNPATKEGGKIHYHDIGDYLSREDKLAKIADYKSIAGIKDWQTIKPDANQDWLNQRESDFAKFTPLTETKGKGVFASLAHGIVTNRDALGFTTSPKTN